MEESAYTMLRTCGGVVIKRLWCDILDGSKRSYLSLIQGAIDIRNQVMKWTAANVIKLINVGTI